MIELIRKLVEAWGPSGYEHQVRELIRVEVADLADEDECEVRARVGVGEGKGGPKVMIAAHMDEIGVMAMYTEKTSGYMRFTPIGGVLNTSLLGMRVRFENGVTGVIAAHDYFGTGRTNAAEIDNFFIDVNDGSSNLATSGTPAIFWRDYEERGARLIAKSMDDRIGCVVAIEAMRRLNKQTPNELYFVFTVQEEVGLRGARAAGYGVDPDLAIALDVTSTGDMAKDSKMEVKLGGGAAIKVHDTGLVVPPAVREWMINRAQSDGIPFQLELLTLGTTDAAGIQTARAGVPSGAISIPCRYVHTTSETVDINDVEACIKLLTGLAGNTVTL